MDSIDPNLIVALRAAKRVAVLTGAGISAESGLATFRGDGGIWAKFRPSELANMQAFLKNPERVWEWYQYRREVLKSASPNPAHIALASWQKFVDSLTIITQNVDGLHQAAGSNDVIELHGSILSNRCSLCGSPIEIDFSFEDTIPKCLCGGMIRPGVVWFGEMLPEEALNRAIDVAGGCDHFLVIGTSAEVYPAASIPLIARDYGAQLTIINPESTPLNAYANYCIYEKAGEILPKIMREVHG